MENLMFLGYGLSVYCAKSIMRRRRLNRRQLIQLKIVTCFSATLTIGYLQYGISDGNEDNTNLHVASRTAVQALNYGIQTLNYQSADYALVDDNNRYTVALCLASGLAILHHKVTTSETILDGIQPLLFIVMINCVHVWADLLLFSMAKGMRVIENGTVTREYVWNGVEWVSRKPRPAEDGKTHRQRIEERRQRRHH